jgi:hypothetical protein
VANTLGTLVGPLYEALDTVSREFVGFIPSVNRDNGNFSRAAIGQTVTSFQTPTVTASDIVPGVTAPNDGDQVFTPLNITITKARRVPIRWNGEEALGLNNAGPGQYPIFVQQAMQAMRTLTNEIEADLAAVAVRSASRAVGTAGTTPFGVANDLTDFAAPARILDDNGTPIGDRHLVISGASMQNIRGKQAVLFKVNEAGTDDLLRRGSVGEVEGFRLHYAPQIPSIVKGTGTGYVVSGGPYAIGATTIAVGTGTGSINPGDTVSFAGDARSYVVNQVNGTALSGQTPTTITIGGPGLRAALPNATAIAVGNSYTPNIAFTRDALLLATRLPALPPTLNGLGDMADDRTVVVDPFSGLAFEISVYRQYRQVHFEVGIVWGVAGIKPEHIATLFG